MFAAMRGTVIDAVVYCGDPSEQYPKWFVKEVLDLCVFDTFGNLTLLLSDETDDTFDAATIVPYRSVILRNKYRELYHLDFSLYSATYHQVGIYYAARREDCVEYFIFTKDTKSSEIPEWIKELYHEGWIVTDMDVVDYSKVIEAVSQPKHAKDGFWIPTVFIRNWKGEVKPITSEEFGRNFDVAYPRY